MIGKRGIGRESNTVAVAYQSLPLLSVGAPQEDRPQPKFILLV